MKRFFYLSVVVCMCLVSFMAYGGRVNIACRNGQNHTVHWMKVQTSLSKDTNGKYFGRSLPSACFTKSKGLNEDDFMNEYRAQARYVDECCTEMGKTTDEDCPVANVSMCDNHRKSSVCVPNNC